MNGLRNSYALLIGVGGVNSKGDNEDYMIDDAQAIYDVLVDEKYAGYPKENVILITGEKANRDEILSSFDLLAKRINKDSKVLIYYSGHGSKYKSKDDYYLELYGARAHNINTHHIKAREIKEKLNALIAERLIFFFDCCHAQGLTKGEGLIATGIKMETQASAIPQTETVTQDPEGLVHNIDDEEGMAIISACKDHQKSMRWKDQKNSVFTTCLLEVLKGEHASLHDDPYIRILDVVEYIIDEVPKRAMRPNEVYHQNPFVNIQFDKNFELSCVPQEKIKTQQPSTNGEQMAEVKPKKEIVKVFRQSPKANNAIIFVHGFSGEAHQTFGKIPYLLAEEERLDGWDMYPFGFNPNVNPRLGKEVWATIKDINRISDNLSSAIKYKFGHYNRVAIVAHSLGGLVAQRAILNLDKANRERLSHVIFAGTPSNGITNDAVKKLWKNKISELIQGQPYISNLRADWTNAFKESYPFNLKVVAATKDDFVSKESALDPFDKEHWITISGDHFSMVNSETKDNDAYHLILETLTDNRFFNQFTDEQEVNLLLGEYDVVIRKLEPNVNDLDERGLEKLIHAMEGIGRSDDAIKILQTHEIAQNDSDMLRDLGGIYKRKYLSDSKLSDGQAAFNCYTKAYKLAKKNNEVEDKYLSAINLAFLNLMLEEDIKDMQKYAKRALKDTAKYPIDNVWKLATIAEANLYLGKLKKAKKFYKKAAKQAGVRDKIAIYSNAYTAYIMLTNSEDPKDKFVTFLTSEFLN